MVDIEKDKEGKVIIYVNAEEMKAYKQNKKRDTEPHHLFDSLIDLAKMPHFKKCQRAYKKLQKSSTSLPNGLEKILATFPKKPTALFDLNKYFIETFALNPLVEEFYQNNSAIQKSIESFNAIINPQNTILASSQELHNFGIAPIIKNNPVLFQSLQFPRSTDFTAKSFIPNPEDFIPLPSPRREKPVPCGSNVIINNYPNLRSNSALIEFINTLKISEESKQYMTRRLEAYYSGEDIFSNSEKYILKQMHFDPSISNKDLAKATAFSGRYIQDVCRNIREKMGFDVVEDDKIKRQLLMLLAIY